jgi:hypothetical protein
MHRDIEKVNEKDVKVFIKALYNNIFPRIGINIKPYDITLHKKDEKNGFMTCEMRCSQMDALVMAELADGCSRGYDGRDYFDVSYRWGYKFEKFGCDSEAIEAAKNMKIGLDGDNRVFCGYIQEDGNFFIVRWKFFLGFEGNVKF